MITPFNDHLLIELPTSQWATADEEGERQDPRSGYGVVVAVPDLIMYLSSYTWIAEQIIDKEYMEVIAKVVKTLKGKTVYFEGNTQVGNVIEDGDKKYATIKISKITGIKD